MCKTKKFLSIIFACLIIVSSTSVVCFASSEQPIENFVETDFDGYVEIKKIHDRDLNIIKRGKRLSDEEKFNELTEALGFEKVQEIDVFDELVNDFENIGDIVTYTQYCSTDSSGNSKVISKNYCLKMVEEAKELEKTKNSSNNQATFSTRNNSDDEGYKEVTETIISGSNTSPDNGYMEISIMIIYKKNEPQGTYNFIASYTWLKNPVTRSTDAISLCSPDFKWSNKKSDFSATFMYTEVYNVNGSITEYPVSLESNNYDAKSANGVYFSFVLPKVHLSSSSDIGSVTVNQNDLTLLLTAKGRVDTYGVADQMIEVTARYAHVQVDLPTAVTFELNPKDIGVSITGGALSKKYYENTISWDYIIHANL